MRSAGALDLLLDLGRFDEADSMMLEGVKRYPHHAPFAASYARVAERRGDLEEAVRRCEAMREKFPAAPEGYTIAMTCLNRLGRGDEAEAIIGRGARRLPDNFQVLSGFASYAEQRHDWDEALRRWEVVRERSPHAVGSLGVVRCLVELGRDAEAKEVLAETGERHPTSAWPTAELARIAALRGNLDEALRHWRDVRLRFASFAPAYPRAAAVLQQAGRDDDADQLLADGVALCPEDLAIHLEYARIAHRQARWREAAERWALVRQKFPECAEAREREAEALAAAGV